MGDSFAETRKELYELMQCMRQARYAPPIPKGVTPAEARVVMALAAMRRRSEEVRPSQVAHATHTTPSALSQTLKTLERKGLIERHRAQADSRAIVLVLTERGTNFADEGIRLHKRHMDDVMSHLGEEDTRCLVRILRQVIDYHERLVEEGKMVALGSAEGEEACGYGELPCA